jgi:hypothetical protein
MYGALEQNIWQCEFIIPVHKMSVSFWQTAISVTLPSIFEIFIRSFSTKIWTTLMQYLRFREGNISFFNLYSIYIQYLAVLRISMLQARTVDHSFNKNRKTRNILPFLPHTVSNIQHSQLDLLPASPLPPTWPVNFNQSRSSSSYFFVPGLVSFLSPQSGISFKNF